MDLNTQLFGFLLHRTCRTNVEAEDHCMFTGICQCHVTLSHTAHTFMDDIDLDLFISEFLKTALDRFKRSLHICFDDDRK